MRRPLVKARRRRSKSSIGSIWSKIFVRQSKNR
ncbi:hypothetical protein GGD56_000514 [Rhizobium mongolense]|uniref:Uncharacterized protein n=1 Tax=Rhizobium mongolense TaxID=57676 RepID=A0ABR6IFQ9_9HYPH|nr:hypothetical protein [Rhizobium mongolense]